MVNFYSGYLLKFKNERVLMLVHIARFCYDTPKIKSTVFHHGCQN